MPSEARYRKCKGHFIMPSEEKQGTIFKGYEIFIYNLSFRQLFISRKKYFKNTLVIGCRWGYKVTGCEWGYKVTVASGVIKSLVASGVIKSLLRVGL